MATVALAGCAGIEEEGDVESIEQEVAAIGPAGAGADVPVPRGGVWEYRDWGIDQGTSWRISDGSWTEGRGPFGYGESYLATTVSYGDDASHKHPTTYFRKSFYVDSNPVVKAYLRVMYDDGFVFYINGKEGGRAAMPSGTVTFSTLSTGYETGNRYVTFDISSQIPNLRPGYEHTLAFEVHQSSASSSDLVFDAELVLWHQPRHVDTYNQGIPRGAEWTFWDQGGDLGTAWRQPGFDDDGWSAGPATLGFGEPYIVTETRRGPITTYFRGRFFADPSAVSEIFADVRFDDGFVAYLNGIEIARRSMPTGTVTASTRAVGHEALAHDRLDWSAAAPHLVDGINYLTVEVHQSSSSSSDLVFDLSLQLGDGAWRAQASGTQKTLNGVWFTDTSRGWAVGDEGTLLRTTDGGAHWAPQAVDIVEDLVAIQFTDAVHGKIVGDEGIILETSDGGETWEGGVFTTSFTGLSFLTPEHGWISANSDLVYHTEDGASYDPQGVGSGGFFTDVEFLDENLGWIVGLVPVPGDNWAAIYHSPDGGETWQQQWISGVHHYYLWDVEVVDASTAWAVGHGSLSLVHEKKLVTRDGGATWNEAPETANEIAIYGIEFKGPLMGWAVGAYGSIVHTDDGGFTWRIQMERVHYEKPSFYDVHFVDEKSGWAVGSDGAIYHTTTGGESS